MKNRSEKKWFVTAHCVVAAKEESFAIGNMFPISFPKWDHIFKIGTEFDDSITPNWKIEGVEIIHFKELVIPTNPRHFCLKKRAPSSMRLIGIVNRVIAYIATNSGDKTLLIH